MSTVPIVWVEAVMKSDLMTYEDGICKRKDLPAGAASWSEGHQTLNFTCPCGCGTVHSVPVNPAFEKRWTWDGNVDKPTLSPSILATNTCRWHGHLIDGVFVPC